MKKPLEIEWGWLLLTIVLIVLLPVILPLWGMRMLWVKFCK